MVVLNAIVADQLVKFKSLVDAKIAENKGIAKEEIIKQVLREELKTSKRILFGGNGYGDEWVKEAEKRGLSNVKNTAEALAFYMSPSSVDLFVKNGIYSPKELEARTEIRYESYNLRIQIEGRVLNEMVQNFVIPSAIRYQKRLADNVQALLSIGQSKKSVVAQVEIISELSKNINKVYELNNDMTNERAIANKLDDAHQKALAYNKKVKGLFDDIRECCDEIERLVDDSDWVLPKYRELLSLN
jgi:glutamine synthetase